MILLFFTEPILRFLLVGNPSGQMVDKRRELNIYFKKIFVISVLQSIFFVRYYNSYSALLCAASYLRLKKIPNMSLFLEVVSA